ncbi:hypothetical protein [Campylobacter sp. RM9328]|nr:hypothetical protein [Campylobacter sp. RM9328]
MAVRIVKKASRNLAICLKYGYVLKVRHIREFKVERQRYANK